MTIAVGGRVRFVNQSGTLREIASDPHPVHTLCPQINQLGVLQNGQARETGVFTSARSCGFHDHNDFNNVLWWGTIVID